MTEGCPSLERAISTAQEPPTPVDLQKVFKVQEKYQVSLATAIAIKLTNELWALQRECAEICPATDCLHLALLYSVPKHIIWIESTQDGAQPSSSPHQNFLTKAGASSSAVFALSVEFHEIFQDLMTLRKDEDSSPDFRNSRLRIADYLSDSPNITKHWQNIQDLGNNSPKTVPELVKIGAERYKNHYLSATESLKPALMEEEV